ncbi:MAG: hypothetical protein LBO66_04095 [Deltaproteobacteria bacterium]|jgi:hypothetical protein|nr:hypothetical protein [Deltaproteobacteria bacterium]
MITAREQFTQNIVRVRETGLLYESVTNLTPSAVDSTDILRMQIILSVSSLDSLIHGLVLNGIIEILEGKREPTKETQKVMISISSVKKALNDGSLLDTIKDEIILRTGYQSYQTPEKISDAMKCFTAKKIWKEVALITKFDTSEIIQKKLRIIVDRRNQIVHQADAHPIYPATRWEIEKSTVDENVNFIETIGLAIYDIAKLS